MKQPRFLRTIAKRKLLIIITTFMVGSATAEPAAIIIRTPVDSSGIELADVAAAADSADGVIDVLLLENSQKVGGKFGQYLAVIFRDKRRCEAWAETLGGDVIDKSMVQRADVLTHGEVWPRDTATAIFKVNDYEPVVDSLVYDGFADGYIRPLMEGQVSADIMSRYTMLYERGDGGLVWSVYEYVSQDTLNSAGEIKERIRATLTETDVSYRNYHPRKDGLRRDGGDTLAIAVGR